MNCHYCGKDSVLVFQTEIDGNAPYRCLRCMLKNPHDEACIDELDILPVIQFLMGKANVTVDDIEKELDLETYGKFYEKNFKK